MNLTTDGIILVDKPTGLSSFGVVARVRRILTQSAGKKVKVGHTGTLDPFASGLMILVTGSYCNRAGEFSKLDKTYEATIRLGQRSTTGDPEGTLTPVSDRRPTTTEVEHALKAFIGTISQTPPVYSAIKINGQRAYKLARAGHAVEVPARRVMIYSLELLAYRYPEVQVRAHVSSGTYIRTLAEDIGTMLDTGAYCVALRRLRVGDYEVQDASLLEESLRPVPKPAKINPT